jgi:hypothetical protein
LARVASQFPERTLPLVSALADLKWIAKGDICHRPDFPVDSVGWSGEEIADPHTCGLVYQPLLDVERRVIVMGRRDHGKCSLGTIAIHQEAFAREDFLVAGESVDDEDLVGMALAILHHLDHRGFFSMNWIYDSRGVAYLTSIRPVPRALFGLFGKGGLDLLQPEPTDGVLREGLRFVVEYHYSSYQK